MNGHPLLVGIAEMRRNWGWFLVLGALLIILGIFALAWSVFATIASVLLFGWLLLVSGVMEIISAFWANRWTGFILHLLAAILDIVIGLLVVAHPLAAAEALTLLLAAFFMIGGIFRIAMSIAVRFPNWGWSVLGGAITLLLGILLWSEWPVSGFWFIGLCVGIELLFRGWWWVMFALGLRTLPASPEAGPAAPPI